jgi:hypothetical protein
MREKSIYTITQIGDEDDIRPRCRGWFSTLGSAEKEIVDSGEFLNEGGYYKFVVIENIMEGISIGIHRNEYWYVWDDDKLKYVKTSKPDAFRHIINFGM